MLDIQVQYGVISYRIRTVPYVQTSALRYRIPHLRVQETGTPQTDSASDQTTPEGTE